MSITAHAPRPASLYRRRWMLVFPLLAVVIALAPLPAGQSWLAAQDTPELPTPITETLLTKDSVPIHITYYRSTLGKDAGVIVLLHMKDGNRFVWQNGLAERLQSAGYAVITVDLRGHGESRGAGPGALPSGNVNQDDSKKGDSKRPKKVTTRPTEARELKPIDYEAMVALDMEAVKKFIFEEHQKENLNMNKTGFIGAEMGASVAAYAALADWLKEPHADGLGPARTPRGQDVRAIALLSPQGNFPGLPLGKVVGNLRNPLFNVAVYVGVGKEDPKDKGQARKIFDQFAAPPNSDKRMYFEEFKASLHGTQLLGKPNINVELRLLAFFDKHLKKFESNWIDRRSRLDRPKS